MRYFLIGEDKSLKDVTDVVLALTGGAMTGNIAYKGSKLTTEIIRFLDNDQDAYGNGISIGGGGTTIVGGGEAARLLEPAPGSAFPERLILANDSGIDFYVNCQNGLEKATHVTLSTAGLLSGHQKAIKSGTAAPSGGSNGDIYIQY
jgi:hypothetical protein